MKKEQKNPKAVLPKDLKIMTRLQLVFEKKFRRQ